MTEEVILGEITPEKCRSLANDLRRKVARDEVTTEQAIARIKAVGCGFMMAKIAASDKLHDQEIKEIWNSL